MGKQDALGDGKRGRCGASILAHVGGIADPGKLQMKTLRSKEGK